MRTDQHNFVKFELVHEGLLVSDLLETSLRDESVLKGGIPAHFFKLALFEFLALAVLLLERSECRVKLGLSMSYDQHATLADWCLRI